MKGIGVKAFGIVGLLVAGMVGVSEGVAGGLLGRSPLQVAQASDDFICFMRLSDGTTRDLSQLCGKKSTPAGPVINPGKPVVPIGNTTISSPVSATISNSGDSPTTKPCFGFDASGRPCKPSVPNNE